MSLKLWPDIQGIVQYLLCYATREASFPIPSDDLPWPIDKDPLLVKIVPDCPGVKLRFPPTDKSGCN